MFITLEGIEGCGKTTQKVKSKAAGVTKPVSKLVGRKTIRASQT